MLAKKAIPMNDIGSLKHLDAKTRKPLRKEIMLIFIALLIFVFSFPLGRYSISPVDLLLILASKVFPIPHTWPAAMDIVVFHVRLPRIFAAVMVGAALATSGAAYQGMLKNPLVSPDILGASAGSGFGAALGIYFSFNYVGIQLSAFTFGLLAVFITSFIGNKVRSNPTLVLVLAGVLVGTLFSSGTSLIKFVADPLRIFLRNSIIIIFQTKKLKLY